MRGRRYPRGFQGTFLQLLKMAYTVKKSLSKNLAGMKFMQKTSNNLTGRDNLQTSGGDLIEKWVVQNVPVVDNMPQRVTCIDSFVECEGLNKLGRFSYNKFNKEIERLSERYARSGGELEDDSGEEEEEATVSVHEMVRRYEDITSKRLLGKHGRSDYEDFDLSPSSGPAGSTGRHKLLENRVSKMDKEGFLKPSY